MQHSFKIQLPLNKVTPELEAAIKNISIVHPELSLGGHIVRKTGNLKRLHLTLPYMLKGNISFTVLENSESLLHAIKLYNLSCSLQNCVITHTLVDCTLEICIVTDSETAKALEKIASKANLI